MRVEVQEEEEQASSNAASRSKPNLVSDLP
jgi:hypothetical protein